MVGPAFHRSEACYAGGTGDLVRYYIDQSFTPTEPFNTITGWPGRLLEQRV